MQFGWWRRSIILSAQTLGFDRKHEGCWIVEFQSCNGWMACGSNLKQKEARGCEGNRLWSQVWFWCLFSCWISDPRTYPASSMCYMCTYCTQPVNSRGSDWFKVKWKHTATCKLRAAVGLVARLSSKSIFQACSLRSPAVRTPVWAWRAFIYMPLLRRYISKVVISVCMTYSMYMLVSVFGLGM